MGFSKHEKTIAIIVVLLLTAVTALGNIAGVEVKGQLAPVQPSSGPIPTGVTPDFIVQTQAYLSVRPTVIGLNQIFLVNMFPIPAPNANRKFLDFKVTITKPSGQQESVTVDSYVADGTQWFEWVADEIGEWTFAFEMPGQYMPAGRYLDGDIITASSGGTNYPQSVYYQPSSTPERTLTVQQDLIASWPPAPLPSDYWTRPVPYEKREWWPIAGDFPWRGSITHDKDLFAQYYPNTNPYWGGWDYAAGFFGPWRGHFTPWVQGPNSAHVAWKQQYAIAGIVGGDWETEIANTGIFGNSGYGRYPEIVYSGRGYMSYTKPGAGRTTQTYWRCFDIRTGELFWERQLEPGESAPSVIEYTGGLLPGGAVSGIHEHVTAINLLSLNGGYLTKYDPWTGAVTANVSIAPMTGSGGTYYINGYVLGVQNLGNSLPVAQRYRLINWTTLGSSSNFASRVQSNISWPWSSLPDKTDYNVGISALVSKDFVAGAPNMTTVRAASIITGQELWSTSIPEWEYSSNTGVADHGKIAILTEQGYYKALDLFTGTVAWESERFDFPWDEPGFGGYNALSAYGLLFRNAYSGVYAFNWTNGRIAWKYEAISNPFETPYVSEGGDPTYSWNIGGAIADGKYYAYNTEHSASVPITRGWQMHCINITTGEAIWKVGLPGAASKHTTDIGPIADGYLALGGSDGYLYVYGKGKSKTTVTAPDVVVEEGSGVVIKGTVMDMSPAQPNTPCVSKDSMALQMEYLHKQAPIDGIWHNETLQGVPVFLSVCDAEGAVVDIGTIITNGYYGTFSMTWTPPSEGQYTIVASFAGDDSYGSSSAATSISVGPTPEEPEPPPESEIPDYTMLIVGMGLAIIIVIAIVGVVLFLKK